MLGWLQHSGCILSDNAARHLCEFRAIDPSWDERWESNADLSFDARAGYVAIKTDPTKIIDLPISQIIEAAGQQTARPFMEFAEHRPFSGLVKQRPQRALAALAYQARRGNFPIDFWQTALADWPDDLPERVQWLFAARLARLPRETISELPHYAPRWIKSNLPKLASRNSAQALAVWDSVFDALVSTGGKAVDSGMGDVFIGGKAQSLSRRTYQHAINGPIGTMTEALFQILDDRNLGANAGIPKDIKERLERLLTAPGEGADHAICEIAYRLNWLFYLDPNWVADRLIRLFSLDSDRAEPAWNGFLHSDNLGKAELFTLLKPHFLGAFEIVSTWHWDDQGAERLHEFLVIACYWNRRSGRYVSYAEARLALQRSSDDGRSHAIWLLASIIRDQGAWKSFGKPFILNAWPKEARYQTEASSRQLAAIAEAAGDNFPDVVRALEPLLVPSGQLDLFVYKDSDGGNDEEGASRLPRKFPKAMLAFLDRLVPDDPGLAAYELGFLVDAIANANAGLRQDPRWRRLSRIVHAR
jgi:hypothetical protein